MHTVPVHVSSKFVMTKQFHHKHFSLLGDVLHIVSCLATDNDLVLMLIVTVLTHSLQRYDANFVSSNMLI